MVRRRPFTGLKIRQAATFSNCFIHLSRISALDREDHEEGSSSNFNVSFRTADPTCCPRGARSGRQRTTSSASRYRCASSAAGPAMVRPVILESSGGRRGPRLAESPLKQSQSNGAPRRASPPCASCRGCLSGGGGSSGGRRGPRLAESPLKQSQSNGAPRRASPPCASCRGGLRWSERPQNFVW